LSILLIDIPGNSSRLDVLADLVDVSGDQRCGRLDGEQVARLTVEDVASALGSLNASPTEASGGDDAADQALVVGAAGVEPATSRL
jgi:hypothetical protein